MAVKIEDIMVTSTFGLSLSIANAVDRIFGTDEETYVSKLTKERMVKPNVYLYINIQTLISSIISSIDKKYTKKILTEDYLQPILDRISHEEKVIREIGEKTKVPDVWYATVKVAFYKTRESDYKIFPFINYREINTDTAKLALLTEIIFDVIKDNYKEIPDDTRRSLVITNMLSDMIGAKTTCDLILPNTGKRIPQKGLNTQLHPSSSRADMSAIPFNKTTLKLFGDKGGKIKKVFNSPTRMKMYKMLVEANITRTSSNIATRATLKDYAWKVKEYVRGRQC